MPTSTIRTAGTIRAGKTTLVKDTPVIIEETSARLRGEEGAGSAAAAPPERIGWFDDPQNQVRKHMGESLLLTLQDRRVATIHILNDESAAGSVKFRITGEFA